jgi:DNA-binding response OmpR family regulator
VVEDDICARELSTTALICAGYKVDAVEDGADAWDMLNAGTYDLLITDNSMPRLTGIELLGKLHSARMTLPVIMATGSLPAHEFAQSPWLMPDATLLKPFVIGDLLANVKTVLCLDESGASHTAHHARSSEKPQSESNRRHLRAGTSGLPSPIVRPVSALAS